MNSERIKDLAVQAGVGFKPRRPYDDDRPDGYVESDRCFTLNNIEEFIALTEQGGLEKFAELLIEQCYLYISGEMGLMWDGGLKKTKQHFGIEQ